MVNGKRREESRFPGEGLGVQHGLSRSGNLPGELIPEQRPDRCVGRTQDQEQGVTDMTKKKK